MERYRREPFLIDIGQRSHRAAVSDSQEIVIVRMLAVMCQDGNGVETGAVVRALPLYPQCGTVGM